MKTIALATLSLILGATVFAEPPQVEISARYEGFDRSRYAELSNPKNDQKDGGVLSWPRITAKSGQRCQIEIAREVPVPETPNGEKTVAPLALDLLPVVKDGKVTLSGKSVLRRRLAQDAAQPLGAISFATQETFFGGAVQDGKELTIEVGDGPKDKSRIVLTVRLAAAASAPDKALADPPKLKIFRLDCSTAELLASQKAAFPDAAQQMLSAEYFQANPIVPVIVAANTSSGIKALLATFDKKAIPVTAKDAGFTISAVQNTQAVDISITHDKHSVNVTVNHGNAVLFELPDKHSPDGHKLFLIRTE